MRVVPGFRLQDRVSQRSSVAGEIVPVMQLAIERNHLDPVFRANLIEEGDGRALNQRQLLLSAIAGVEQQDDVKRRVDGCKEGNLLRRAVFTYFEFFLPEIGDIRATARTGN